MRPGRLDAACGALLAVAAASAAATRIAANDLWWHLKAGEWIVSHGAVPRADDFSFTSAGTPWVDHAWLWQVIAWELHDRLGIPGLAILKLSCAGIVAALGFAALRRREVAALPSALVVLVALAGARFRLTDRPEVASLALLSIFAFVVLISGLTPARRAIAAAAVCCLWANVHAGVLLGPALAGATALGSLMEGTRAMRDRRPGAATVLARARGEALAAAASAAGMLLNPYGFRILLVPLKLGAALADPRLVNPEWLSPAAATFPLFFAILAAVIGWLAFRILRRHDAAAWRSMLLVGGMGTLAISGSRHIGFFFAALPFAVALARDPADRAPSGARAALLSPLLAVAAAVAFPLIPSAITASPGFGVDGAQFPAAETDFVAARLPAPRRMYNDVGHGGYLIWRLYPADRVFIDGRNEVHAALLGEIARALDDGRAWSDLLDRHDVRAALVRYRDERIAVAGQPAEMARSFAALHFPRSRWALVFWGDSAMVFVKRGAGADALIASEEYQFAHPEDTAYQIERCRGGDRALLDGILADLRRRVAAPPRSERAERLLAEFGALGGH
ncbi:MAG: hypothetical protein HY049_02610 [Acidobacteria bacterium]|nr:hypothetical protein [Acidobacteriota bacterium]